MKNKILLIIAITVCLVAFLAGCSSRQMDDAAADSSECDVISSEIITRLSEILWIDGKSNDGIVACFGFTEGDYITIDNVTNEIVDDYYEGDIVNVTYEKQLLSNQEERVVLVSLELTTGLYDYEYYLSDFVNFHVKEVKVLKSISAIGDQEVILNNEEDISQLMDALESKPVYSDYCSRSNGDGFVYVVTFVGEQGQSVELRYNGDVQVTGADKITNYGFHKSQRDPETLKDYGYLLSYLFDK